MSPLDPPSPAADWELAVTGEALFRIDPLR